MEPRHELRDYQLAAVELARNAYRKGARRVLLVAPTGAGKTVIFCWLARAAIAKGNRVLVVAHRSELIDQAVAKLAREGITDVGVIRRGPSTNPEAAIQVASIQTLLKAQTLPEATLVILDEAHHYVADKWGEVASSYAKAKVLGVTATPMRADKSPLGDLFDVLVPVSTTSELISAGHLVPCEIRAPSKRRQSLPGEPVDLLLEHAAGRPAVVFCHTLDQAEKLATGLTAKGVPAAHVDGTMKASERAARLAAFASGQLQVLCNMYVLTEGWDAPLAEVCMLARHVGSVANYLQMVGRVLRPHPGKEKALLLDLYGAVFEFGLPDEDRVYSLDGDPIGRAPTKTCPACKGEVPLSVTECPLCWYVFEPVPAAPIVEPGEALSVIDLRAIMVSFFEALVEECRFRGHKPGWVYHKFFGRFGIPPWGAGMPRGLWGKHFPKEIQNDV